MIARKISFRGNDGERGPQSGPYVGPPPLKRWGTRSAADKIEYNEAFYVVTSDWNSIASVVLMGTGAATHSFDHNQRYVPLEFTKRQTGDLQVTAPAHGHLAPPGVLHALHRRQ